MLKRGLIGQLVVEGEEQPEIFMPREVPEKVGVLEH